MSRPSEVLISQLPHLQRKYTFPFICPAHPYLVDVDERNLHHEEALDSFENALIILDKLFLCLDKLSDQSEEIKFVKTGLNQFMDTVKSWEGHFWCPFIPEHLSKFDTWGKETSRECLECKECRDMYEEHNQRMELVNQQQNADELNSDFLDSSSSGSTGFADNESINSEITLLGGEA
jgi:hypothetical protein